MPDLNWIDRLPPKWRPYARLLRLDKPAGSWLLLLPCWWSLSLASDGLPDLGFLLLFAVGAVLMRGAGCIVNDVYDRDFDRLVERTKDRPLACGSLQVSQALFFLVMVLLAAATILWQFNRFTQGLAIASLALVFTYPLAKRVTWWPQLVLGFTFNWGALVGWSAVQSTLSSPALLLYAGGLFWTLAYDTIYAHQDKRDDMLVGVKSLALKLGTSSKKWIGCFFAVALLLFGLAGHAADEGMGFYLFWGLAALHAAWQVRGWNEEDGADCARRFKSNRDFGLLLFAGCVFGKFF